VFKKIILLIFISFNSFGKSDLVVVGPVKFNDGIFRLAITWMEQLKKDLSIDFISTGYVDLTSVSDSVQSIIKRSVNNISKVKNDPANVSVLISSPWTLGVVHADHVPNSKIKIAYSMLEGTEIPQKWVEIFNERFDSVVVPDQYLVGVYKNCGVKIPIFVLPCGLMLQDFLNKPLKKTKNKIFRFGTSAVFTPGKNHETTVKSFANNFANNSSIELHIHGRGGDDTSVRKLIKDLNLNNAHVINKSLNHQEYIDFLRSLDCYVLLSKGEGFSITPRESMALGIPCILSNNTSQQTICRSGLVESVKSEILEPAYYAPFNCNVGYKFNCKVYDAAISMKNVFNNYQQYLNKSIKMRQWSSQYEYNNLRNKYLNLIKPKKVVLGDKNIITNDYLMTNSLKLFKKYQSIK